MNRGLVFYVALLAFSLLLSSQSIDIYYDGQPGQSEAFKSACFIENLLGHFHIQSSRVKSIRTDLEPISKTITHVFVVCEEGAPEFTQSFIDHLLGLKAEIIWIHMHSEQLLSAAPARFSLRHQGYDERDDWRIDYKGESFPKEDPLLNVVTLTDTRRAKIIASITDDDQDRHPYVIRSGNLWLFCDSPFSYANEGGRFLILADLLHDILGQDHPRDHRALVRIEDISPESDPQSLNGISRTLRRERIPWQFSLIPIFIDPGEQAEVYLSDRPKLTAELKRMIDLGAVPVLHGVTHQHRGLSGDDYEFWNDISGIPISHETPDWVEQRLRLGVKECLRNGIYPLSWETPHYSASQQNYSTFARFFDTFYDRVMAAELPGTQQIFPYPVLHRRFGVTIIPENLGYIDQDNPDPAPLLAAARRMRVVRDGVASFFFHPFIDPAILKKIVGEMKKMGWRFISLREFPANLTTRSCWVTTSGGSRDIVATNQFMRRMQRNPSGKVEYTHFSEKRLQGIFTETAHPPKGSVWISETIDFLPPKPDPWIKRVGKALHLRRSSPNGSNDVLQLTRSLIILNPRADYQEKNDQESLLFLLNIFGFHCRSLESDQLARLPLDTVDLLVIPQASARLVQESQAQAISSWVRGGGTLILDGPSPLMEVLRIEFRNTPITVRAVHEITIPVENGVWTKPALVHSLVDPALTPLALEESSRQPLAGVKSYGKGKILAFATLFDPDSPFGTSRFPFFAIYLKNSLALPFHFRRDNLECYFDPGFHPHTSWEKLVKQWKESGIRVIYLAAWHFYDTYRFDYQYFIQLCHQAGIAVYAWFEFPQVSPAFWEKHPQWREKTATGKDALCHWRLQMNLFRPEVREAAGRFFLDILRRFDWDGINLAEINFDTNEGAKDPDKFTPMNRDIRSAFQKQTGVDPQLLFDPRSPHHWKRDGALFARFLRFRADLVVTLHRHFLDLAEQARRTLNREIEVIVTVMDSLCHPEIYEECGIDTRDIIRLMSDYDFTLQVEDPARSWVTPPDRYLRYYETYKKWISDPRRLMFDINCIPNRDISRFPLATHRLAGSELAATLYFASFPSGRAALYSEQTILPIDLDMLPHVLGSDIEFTRLKNGYAWQAREPFKMSFRSALDQIPIINGIEWPLRDTRHLFLPSGGGHLSFRKRSLWAAPARTLQIVFDGPISSLSALPGGGFRLAYHSKLPVPMTTKSPFHKTLIDARPFSIPDAGGIVLPRGSHVLTLIPESPAQQTIEQVGYFSSSLFTIAGILAVLILSALWILSRRRP